MIVLESQNPPVGLWFMGIDEKTDFLGCLERPLKPEDKYRFTYRFRYHKDAKVFESEDVKHWYSVNCDYRDDDEAIHFIREIVLRLASMASHDGPEPASVDELLYRDYGDFAAFMRAFQEKPYAYARMESKEKVAEYERASANKEGS